MVRWGGSGGKYATRREKKHKTPGKKHKTPEKRHKTQNTTHCGTMVYGGEGVERGGDTEKDQN